MTEQPDVTTLKREYNDAGLAQLFVGIDAFLSTTFDKGIKDALATILAVEAPIEKGQLFKEVCGSYGADPSAIDVLRKVEGFLKQVDRKETRFAGSVFVWRADQDPTRYFEYRVAEPPTTVERHVTRVCYEELSALLYDVVLRESPVDIDLMIDIAIDEAHLGGPRPKARSVLKNVFEAACTCGLLRADDNGDVQIARTLEEIAEKGTGSAAVSKVAVVEAKKDLATRLSIPASSAANVKPAENDKPLAAKRARSQSRSSSAVRIKADERSGILTDDQAKGLYVPEVSASERPLAEHYLDPQTVRGLIGATVEHSAFGRGKVKKISNNRAIIAFGSELKQFAYPTVFTNEIVRLV